MRFRQQSPGGIEPVREGFIVKKRKKHTSSVNIVSGTLSLFIHIVVKTLLKHQKDRML